MSDYRLALMAGIDVPIPELQLVAHVPTIKDIAYAGEAQYFQAVQYICLDKEVLIQDERISSTLTNFQVLMKVLDQSEDKEKRVAIITLLKLLFPDYVAMITKNSIILTIMGDDARTVLIDDSNFEILQDALKQILCVNSTLQGENIVYNPGNAAAKRIADKLMRGRQRVAAQKNAGKQESVLTRYMSILSIGTQAYSLEQCANLNMFQLFDLIERYTAFVEWDTDLRVRLAGGKPDKTVEPWMRDLHPKV